MMNFVLYQNEDEAQASKCSDKLGFETKAQANGTLVSAEYMHGNKNSLKIYKCTLCDLYHLASR